LPEAWCAGTPSDAYDTNTMARAAPGFSPPAPGERGSAAHDREHVAGIVSMVPRDHIVVPVTESDTDRGTYEYDGTVTARQRTAECYGVETPVR
jgi:hypothetical protein